MKTTKKIVASAIFLAIAGFAQVGVAAPMFTQCSALPSTDNSASGGCNVLITNTNSGLTIAVDPKASGFGGEDSFVGIVNNGSAPLTSLSLSSSTNIFGFDADGTLPVRSGVTNSDYAPAGVTFSGINAAGTAGVVNFAGGLAPGAVVALELEENLSAAGLPPLVVTGGPGPGGPILTPSGGTVPEPATVALLGLGLFGFAALRRKSSRNKNV